MSGKSSQNGPQFSKKHFMALSFLAANPPRPDLLKSVIALRIY